MTRFEFQALARERLEDAKSLLAAGRYSCAYYICGYVVECAFKACISRQTRQDDFPSKDARDYYTHDLTKLLKYASLEGEFRDEVKQKPVFDLNWTT